MRDLSRFLVNPFDDDGISLDELLAFATDNLQRLIARNAGSQWNTRITATTTALQTVSNCSSSDNIKFSIRRAAKQAKDNFRAQLPENLAKLHGAVAYKCGPNSTQMTLCFPAGRSVFEQSTDDALTSLLQPLAANLTSLVALVGPEPASDAGGLHSTWIALYAASESSSGTKAATEAEQRAARRVLQHELFVTLLDIAKFLENKPEEIGEYMQQSLLENPVATVPPPAPPPGP